MTTASLDLQPMIGDPAPSFDLIDTKGNMFSLADQRGKFLVIHFGTSW
ncbi:MAG: TlpA family protein disulfide reductase [Dehalococcoidia bacterium]